MVVYDREGRKRYQSICGQIRTGFGRNYRVVVPGGVPAAVSCRGSSGSVYHPVFVIDGEWGSGIVEILFFGDEDCVGLTVFIGKYLVA